MASYRNRGTKSKPKWEYRIHYKNPVTGELEPISEGGFDSKGAAKEVAEAKEKLLKQGYDLKVIKLKTFILDWLENDKRGHVRKNTFQTYENSINNHILPYFKEISLQKITSDQYQAFLNKLVEDGSSKRSIEIIHTTMKNAMEKAVQQKRITDNPCKYAKIRAKATEKKIKFIETDQIESFLRHAYQYGYEHWIFYNVLIETGLRKGEAAALQWNDIDLKEKTINVHKSLDFQAKNDDELFGDTKNYNSKRIISIDNKLAQELHFHMKWQNQNKLALKDLYRHDLNLVLCRNDGSPMAKSTLFNSFRRILKRADMPDYPIHSLRHTHAVQLLEAGVDMKGVQERLGHGSMQITADVYAHVSKIMNQQTMDKYEEQKRKRSQQI
ncbi:tyrosine-type recombinase/integrase [Jeotgalibacillus soli]|uniref:Integrase n=1 Tax=Jeotgalibacillus soli TaxID=889306 RepID=A0A0C2V7S4_9BACL|nr:site-specific integrase [Jeotgalibacillus soli]KIL44997.1 hypothetical protein KP78_25410 [Jeotgalibacillus soli]